MLDTLAVLIALVVIIAVVDAGRWVYFSKQDPETCKHSIADLITEWFFERVMRLFGLY